MLLLWIAWIFVFFLSVLWVIVRFNYFKGRFFLTFQQVFFLQRHNKQTFTHTDHRKWTMRRKYTPTILVVVCLNPIQKMRIFSWKKMELFLSWKCFCVTPWWAFPHNYHVASKPAKPKIIIKNVTQCWIGEKMLSIKERRKNTYSGGEVET